MKVLLINKTEETLKCTIADVKVNTFARIVDGEIILDEPIYSVEYDIEEVISGKKFKHLANMEESEILSGEGVDTEKVLLKADAEIKSVSGKAYKDSIIKEQ